MINDKCITVMYVTCAYFPDGECTCCCYMSEVESVLAVICQKLKISKAYLTNYRNCMRMFDRVIYAFVI